MGAPQSITNILNINVLIIINGFRPPFVPPLVDHTRYICHASARLRVDANMLGLALGYAAVCLLSRLSFAEGATQAAFGIRLAVRGGYRSATSTHETISSSIEPPHLLSGANY